jgi:hypothetical protein
MARTPSNTDLPLGTICPPFELPCVLCDNMAYGRDDIFAGPDDSRHGLLVAFLSVHCPFVQHMEQAFTALAKKYAGQIATVAICSNDAEAFPEDAPNHMREQGLRLGWTTSESKESNGSNGNNENNVRNGSSEGNASSETTETNCLIPYLHDASQEVAHEFHAACTPDLYLFNSSYELVYHAQFDRTRPYRQSDANAGIERHPEIHAPAHGADLEAAIQALIAGAPPITPQIPGLGCNIKWR